MAPNNPVITYLKLTDFNLEDPFLSENQLTVKEHIIRNTEITHCQNKLIPRLTWANHNRLFHWEIMSKMIALGLLVSTIFDIFVGVGKISQLSLLNSLIGTRLVVKITIWIKCPDLKYHIQYLQIKIPTAFI